MVAEARSLTFEDFLALPDDGNRHEFVRGAVRTMPPLKGVHGKIEARLIVVLGRYLEDRARVLGWTPEQGVEACERLVGFLAGGEFGMRFTLPDDPHQVRGADVAYVPAEQFEQLIWDQESYFPAVPALVIEVVSPTDKADDVEEKVQDYLAGGARRVWCVYPRRRRIHIHSVDGPTRILGTGDTLVDDDILPGFSLPLAWIF